MGAPGKAWAAPVCSGSSRQSMKSAGLRIEQNGEHQTGQGTGGHAEGGTDMSNALLISVVQHAKMLRAPDHGHPSVHLSISGRFFCVIIATTV